MKAITYSFVKTFSIIALTLACSSSFTQAALLAHWSFNETSGNIAYDSAGSFHGTLSPTGATFVPGGVSGGAINISKAENGFVNMGNVLHLTTGDFSIVAWLKMPVGESTPDSAILSKHAAFTRNGYFLHVNQSTGLAMQSADKVFFYQGGTGVGQLQASETPISTTSVNDGNWHQIVAVYRAGGIKSIYVDGAPAESSKPSQSFIGNSVALLIGGVNENGVPKSRLNGTVDEVQIYNHALTDAEINSLYESINCAQNVAALEAQLAAANATIASLQNDLNAAQNALLNVDQSLQRLESHFQSLFDPQFQISGATTPEAVDNLVEAIQASNRGTKQNLFFHLRGQ